MKPVKQLKHYIILALVAILMLAANVREMKAQSIVVTNNNDSGTGSLRDAINYANSQVAGSITNITFSNTPLDIRINSGLPAITRGVNMVATPTQEVILSGINLTPTTAGNCIVLDTGSSGSTIQGIKIVDFYNIWNMGGLTGYAEGATISISASSCKIKDLTIEAQIIGIGLVDVSDCEILDNTIIVDSGSSASSGHYAIYSYGSVNGLIIRNNTINTSHGGIRISFVEPSYPNALPAPILVPKDLVIEQNRITRRLNANGLNYGYNNLFELRGIFSSPYQGFTITDYLVKDIIIRNNLLGGTNIVFDGRSQVVNHQLLIDGNDMDKPIIRTANFFGTLIMTSNVIRYGAKIAGFSNAKIGQTALSTPAGNTFRLGAWGFDIASGNQNIISQNIISVSNQNGSEKAIRINMGTSAVANNAKLPPILSNITQNAGIYSARVTGLVGDNIEFFVGDRLQNAQRYVKTVNMTSTSMLVTLDAFTASETYILATATDIQNNTSELSSISSCTNTPSFPSAFSLSSNNLFSNNTVCLGSVHNFINGTVTTSLTTCAITLYAQISTPLVGASGGVFPTGSVSTNNIGGTNTTNGGSISIGVNLPTVAGIYYIRVVSFDGTIISPTQQIEILSTPIPIRPTISISPNPNTVTLAGQVFTLSTNYSTDPNYVHNWNINGVISTGQIATYTANNNTRFVVSSVVSSILPSCPSETTVAAYTPNICSLAAPIIASSSTLLSPSCSSEVFQFSTNYYPEPIVEGARSNNSNASSNFNYYGDYYYYWVINNQPIVTTQTANYTAGGTIPVIVSVYIIDNVTGCQSPTTTQTYTPNIGAASVFGTPAFTSPTTAAATDGSITGSISATSSGSYTLEKNGAAVIGSTQTYTCASGTCTPFSFTGLEAGSYQIVATSAAGCVSNSTTIVLTAPISCAPIPVYNGTSITPTCTGNTISGTWYSTVPVVECLRGATITLLQNGLPYSNPNPCVNEIQQSYRCYVEFCYQNLPAGFYEVILAYGNSCTTSSGIINLIAPAPAHTFTSTFTNPTTATATDGIITGSITVNAAGTYILKRGNVPVGTAQNYSCPSSGYPCTISAVFNGLGVGNYQIVATSAAGCITISNVIVLTVPRVLCGTNCQDKQVTSCTIDLVRGMNAVRRNGRGIPCRTSLGAGLYTGLFNSGSQAQLPLGTNLYNVVMPLSLDCNYTTNSTTNPTRNKLLSNNVVAADFCGNSPFALVPYKKYFGVTLQQRHYSFNPIWKSQEPYVGMPATPFYVDPPDPLGVLINPTQVVDFADPKFIIQGKEGHIPTSPIFTPGGGLSPIGATLATAPIPNPIDANPGKTVNEKYEIFIYTLSLSSNPDRALAATIDAAIAANMSNRDFEALYDINVLKAKGFFLNTNHIFELRDPVIDCKFYNAALTQDDMPKYIKMQARVDRFFGGGDDGFGNPITENPYTGPDNDGFGGRLRTVYLIANYGQYIKFTESKVTNRIVITPSASIPTQVCKRGTFTVPFTTNCTSPDATYSVGLYQGANFYPDLGVSTTSPISVTIPNDPTLVAGLAQLVITSSEGYTSAPMPITITTGLSAISAQVAGNGEVNGTCSNYTYNLTAIGDASYTYTWEIERIGTRTGMQVSVTLPEQIEGVEFILTATSGGCSISVRGVIRNLSRPLPQITIGSTTQPTCKNPTAGSISVFIGGQLPSRDGTPVLYQNGAVVFGIDPVVDCPRLINAWGCNYDYTGLSAGDYEIIYTYGNGCTVSSGTISLTLPPIRTTLTINNTLNPSCGNTGNGSITATLSGVFETIPRENTFVTLYQEGIPMGSTLPFGCSGRVTQAGCSFELDFPNLPAGNYEIVVIDANGCRISSGNIALITTAPVVTVCAQPLSCSPTITPKINIIASYPNAPANFGNKFSCKIFRQNGGALMKTTTINTGATTITLNQTLPAEKIIVGETVLVQLTPLVNCADPACNVFEEDKCIVSYAVTFDQPVLTVSLAKNIDSPALPVITTVANVLTYEICQFPLIVDASVSSSNICGVPDVYTWTITKNNPTTGAVIATVPNTDGTFTITEALGAGTYTATVTHSTLGCVASKTFDVRIIAPPKVNVTTTDQICSRNGIASAGINDYTGGVTYAWQLLPTQIATVGTPVLDATGGEVVGAQIDNLLPGYYQCIVTIPSGCIFKTPFTIKGAIKILQNTTQDIVISNTVNNQIGCEVTATGIVVFPTIPAGMTGSGIFQVEWHYLQPKRDEDGNLINADNQLLPLINTLTGIALTPAQYEASIVFEDIVVFTETIPSTLISGQYQVISNLPIDKFAASVYPNALYLRGKYYVIIKDVNDCPFTSPVQELRKPNASREWEMCLSWEDPDPVIKPVVVPPINTAAIAASEASNELDERVKACVKRQKEIAEIIMGAQCDSAVTDDFSFRYTQKTHHYTLYYYDRAGRLTKTVPPEGVQADGTRASSPLHRMATTYEYNSLGQLVSQKTPDGGTSNFIYDNKGQLRFSQNDKQKLQENNAYSYTYYDALGRINEVGQSRATQGVAPVFGFDANNPVSIKDANETLVNTNSVFPFNDFSANTNNNEQITHTVYTNPKEDINYFSADKPQRNLQNRVSYTYTLNKGDTDLSKAAYTYYSYDVHGNVEWMVQDVPGMGKNYIAYEYDLISGKVLKVSYNENRKDKFFHRYDYDEDNRLTKVETSKDGNMWDTDAIYDYYKHGPLKRVGLGEGQIQGLDYVYTIHGWLKGINSPVNGQADDIGKDGTVATKNANVAKDAFGMALGYYQGDYRSDNSAFSNVDQTPPVPPNTIIPPTNQFSLEETAPNSDLYNGNISSWGTSMRYHTAPGGVDTWTNKSFGSKFRYDKLNRIKASREYVYTGTGATGNWASEGTKLGTSYKYDANGNIEKLIRKDQAGVMMDSLYYEYEVVAGSKINRLKKVADLLVNSPHDKDIEGDNDYIYDRIGNLTRDEKEKITIDWTAYGKVSTVTPTSYNSASALDAPENKKKKLFYLYDASGNRIVKEAWKVTGFNANGEPVFDEAGKSYTYYVRDAQGNVMSTYERSNKAVGAGTTVQAIYKQAEISLYGSDRLGQYKPTDVSISTLYSSLNTNLQNNPTFGDSERITENANLITSKADNLVNTTPSFNITGITNFVARTAPLQANTILQSNIAGQSSDNVAIGETIQNEMELYSVVAKDYFGQPNVCLLYDKNNLLVANSGGIIADANSKNLLTRHPSDPNKYWLFTRNAIGNLYRTEIVFALNAANVRVADVPVATKNQLLTTNVGAHFTAVEDRKRNVLFLYTTRRAPSSNTSTPDAELITLKITESAVSAPAMMAKLPYTETDLYQGGELQISADGKQLLWYHLGQRAAFFDYQNLQPHTFLLEDGMVAVLGGENAGIPLIPAQIPNPLAGLPAQVPNPLRNEFTLRTSAYIEIDKLENENNIYFTQKNIVNVDKWYKNSILQLGVTNGGNFRRSKRTGEVYQAFDGLVSLGTGLPVQVHTITDVPLSAPTRTTASRLLRVRNYELKDHLGNVRVIVADQKQEDASAKVQSYSNYYAFGMEMPGMQYADNQEYRYGYNGQEKSPEIADGHTTALYWEYDSRIGRRWNLDPIPVTWESEYATNRNNPILYSDPNGDIPRPWPLIPVAVKAIMVAFGIGVVTDVGMQVGTNVIMGKQGKEIVNINYLSPVLSGGANIITGGLSTTYTGLKTAITVGKALKNSPRLGSAIVEGTESLVIEGTKSLVEWKPLDDENTVQTVFDGTKSVEAATTEILFGTLGGPTVKKGAETIGGGVGTLLSQQKIITKTKLEATMKSGDILRNPLKATETKAKIQSLDNKINSRINNGTAIVENPLSLVQSVMTDQTKNIIERHQKAAALKETFKLPIKSDRLGNKRQ